MFEQNTRYPTLGWQPGDDLKPFLPPTQAKQPLETQQTNQLDDVQDLEFEDESYESEFELADQEDDQEYVEDEQRSHAVIRKPFPHFREEERE